MGRSARIVAVVFIMSGCSGADVSGQYKDMAALNADEIVQKGWLPAILPQSTRDIRVNNNLDLNVSWGEFMVSRSEYQVFLAATQPYSKPKRSDDAFHRKVLQWQAVGNDARQFSEEDFVWVFLCSKHLSKCEYRMWPTVSGA